MTTFWFLVLAAWVLSALGFAFMDTDVSPVAFTFAGVSGGVAFGMIAAGVA